VALKMRRGASVRTRWQAGIVIGCALLTAAMTARQAVFAAHADDPPPLLPAPTVSALAGELSGSNAKRHVQALTLNHRMRGSRGFSAAMEYIRTQLEASGLKPELIRLPADGEIFYGTQRSRPAWDAVFAELWELPVGEAPVDLKIASYAATPVALAQDSAAGELTADLVDVGEGTKESDYKDRQVEGRFVLAAAQPGPVSKLAVGKFGAKGIVSYAQNQRTAWWREDETLVRWGHLETFPAPSTFAFMVSLKQARAWQEKLARGETVRLRGKVEAGQRPGSYDILTTVIPGSDAALASSEVVFSCHLDHPNPGANDNASGCATILEVARALATLIHEQKIPAPRRSIRFVWPPEVEGTIALLNARPSFVGNAAAAIHMDMVGGAPDATKAVFHVTRSPRTLPTFVNDVSEAFGRFVNDQTSAHAGGTTVSFPLVDPQGGKEALLAEIADYTMGSDHDVWAEGSFRVPVIYLNDWPDRYIHTNKDVVANIDATKLLRAGFIGAASAVYLADLTSAGVPALHQVMRRHALERTAGMLQRAARAHPEEAGNLVRFHLNYERAVFDSVTRFAAIPKEVSKATDDDLKLLEKLARADIPVVKAGPSDPSSRIVYERRLEPRGPMSGFGYDYFEDHAAKASIPRPGLLDFKGAWGSGGEYAYETLNLVDGVRTVGAIRDDLSAIYGPVPLDLVAGYLSALEKIGVLVRE